MISERFLNAGPEPVIRPGKGSGSVAISPMHVVWSSNNYAGSRWTGYLRGAGETFQETRRKRNEDEDDKTSESPSKKGTTD